MKKLLKWTGIILGSLVLGVVIVVWLMQYKTFDAAYPDIRASTDSSIVARGKYLVMGPAHCTACHFNPDSMAFYNDTGKVILSGGTKFVLPIGTIQSPNLTSDKETGIGNLSDMQIARALRYGVGHDGRALFDFMPFQNLSDDDLTALISFLRTLPPVKNKVTVRNLNLLGYGVKAFLIKPVGPSAVPAKSVKADTTAEYGEYIANNVSNCRGCHTNRDLMTGAYTGKFYAGGFHMEGATDPEHYECVTPNLTPDPKTGHIYGWSEDVFLQRLHAGRRIEQSAMAWEQFSRLKDNDIKAIYKYLQTLAPVENNTGPILVKIEK